MEQEFTLEDAVIILKRRIWTFALPAAALFVVGLIVIMLLPAKYTAQGVILVESAEISSTLVPTTINALAQERIQTIETRVKSSARLIEVANKYGLYPRAQGYSESERVAAVKRNLALGFIRTDGARASSQRDNTIAFTLSFTDKSPDKAFNAANEFMSLFLTEDVRTRTLSASSNTEFLKDETARLGARVAAMETAIAKYKSENGDALPEHLASNTSLLDRTRADVIQSEGFIVSLEEELRFLETQLASFSAGAGAEGGPANELARKRAELTQLRAVYQDAHPSVKAIRDEIASLERALAPSRDLQALQKRLTDASAELRALERAETVDAAAVEAKRAEIARAQSDITAFVVREARTGDFLSVQLQGRLAVANSRLELLRGQRDQAKKAVADLEGRIARTPEVERGLRELTRDYDQVRLEHAELLAKQQDAQLAENLEANRKAEKFSIIEPAARPEKPSSPDRVKLAVLNLFAAIGLGAGAVFLTEQLLSTIRGKSHMTQLLGAEPIAVIPFIIGDVQDKPPFFARLKTITRRQAAAAATVVVMGAAAASTLDSPDVADEPRRDNVQA